MSGCIGGDRTPPPAFMMGGPIDGERAASGSQLQAMEINVIEVVAPGVVQTREKFNLLVRVALPKNDTLPTHLVALLRAQNKNAGTFPLEPDARDGATYSFRGGMRAPPKPGDYRIDIDAVYLVAARNNQIIDVHRHKTIHKISKGPPLRVNR
jgi:hypothetical protein